MKIKLQTRYSTPHVNAEPGCIIDVSEDEAKQLIAGRYATPLAAAPGTEAPAEVETADTTAPENAAVRTGARGRRTRPAAPASEKPAE